MSRLFRISLHRRRLLLGARQRIVRRSKKLLGVMEQARQWRMNLPQQHGEPQQIIMQITTLQRKEKTTMEKKKIMKI